jgi:hypothetical protein
MRSGCSLGRLAAVAVLAALCGCSRDHVELTIEPRLDGSFVRTIRLWQTHNQKPGQLLAPSEELVKAAKPHYKEKLDAEGEALCFQGTFRDLPPDLAFGGDVNHGGYLVLRSRLGSLAHYRERRPGRTDFYTAFKEVEPALDLLIQFAAAMVRQQLEGEEGRDRLVAFIEGPLRRDARDLAMLAYAERLRHRGGGDGLQVQAHIADAAATLMQFGIERGYLEASQLPKLLAAKDPFNEWLMALIAKKMSRPLDAQLRGKLAFLFDDKRRDAAIAQAAKALAIPDEKRDATLERFAMAILSYDLLNTQTRLSYILRCPQHAEVLYTSGRWDKKANHVVWRGTLAEAPVADLFHALWTAPDAAWQTQHLGRVALNGQALAEYVMWEHGLAPDQAARWRTAIDRLDPAADLKQQLAAIHLTPPPPDKKPTPEPGAQLILDALYPPTTK